MKSNLIFLSGLGLGTVLGLLIAPEPGSVSWGKVKAEADRIVGRVVQKRQLKQEVKKLNQGVEMTT